MGNGFIGIFDSGVGGLSVWREIVKQLPSEPTVYVGDQAHVPYGSRSVSQVLAFAEEISRFLLNRGAKIIVIASNTISAAALYSLRNLFPHVPFVGMEPALKPATERTRTRAVGVIATPATFEGQLFANLIRRYTNDVCVLSQACPGLVDAVEAGELQTKQTVALVEQYLAPMIEADVDQLVLGCTHYPFLLPVIERIVGPGTCIIDPAPSVARQVAYVLRGSSCTASATMPSMRSGNGRSGHLFYTTGHVQRFTSMIDRLIAPPVNGERDVRAAAWQSHRLEAL